MDPARPLRDVFADLATDEDARAAHAADPDGFLQAHGHAGLPGDLVGEAIVNYADTAPPEIAEHLAPFVLAHSPVPVEDVPDADAAPTDGLHLLATAPAEPYLDALPDHLLDHLLDGAGAGHGHLVDPGVHAGAGTEHGAAIGAGAAPDPFDFDFGHGDQPDQMHHTAGDPAGHDLGGLGGHLGAELGESHVDDSMADLGHTDAGGWADDHGLGADLGGELGHDLGHDVGHDLDPEGHEQPEHDWLAADGHHPVDGDAAADGDADL